MSGGPVDLCVTSGDNSCKCPVEMDRYQEEKI